MHHSAHWKALRLPLAICLTTFLLFRFLLFLGYVPSASMEPAIPAGSWILGTRIYGELKRGEIVVFEKEGRYLVKRIAALPGDTVYLNDNTHTVSVNSSLPGATRILLVPEKNCFLLGDNDAASVDSRFWEDPFCPFSRILAVLLQPDA